MLPLRYTARWRAAGLMLLLAVLASTLMPALWLLPEIGLSRMVQLDKWAHGIAFLALALWFCGQYSKRSYWRVGLGLLLFGALIEICQYYTVYRTAEWQDLYADAIGIVFGLLGGLLGFGGWSLRFERWWAARQRVEG